MSIIEIKKLKKSYGKKLALDIPSLNVEHGASIGVFGANGSGKSTLIKCITGLLPYEGQIFIDGNDIRKQPSILADVGILIEEPALYKDMTGRKNIMYFCSDTTAIHEYAELLGITDILDKKVKSYSLGMRQKLAILLACVKGKKLILLDEPFNGLDIISVEKAIELLNLCRQRGASILLTSHQLEISQKAIDMYYLLKNTQIYDCTAPKPFGGLKYLVEFFDIDSVKSAYSLLSENDIICSLSDYALKIQSDGQSVSDIAQILKDFNVRKIEDISYSIKEAYLQMEIKK